MYRLVRILESEGDAVGFRTQSLIDRNGAEKNFIWYRNVFADYRDLVSFCGAMILHYNTEVAIGQAIKFPVPCRNFEEIEMLFSAPPFGLYVESKHRWGFGMIGWKKLEDYDWLKRIDESDAAYRSSSDLTRRAGFF
jgi:hypothetical protein